MSCLKLRRDFIECIMPQWLEVAFDERAGQFTEGLTLGGERDEKGVVRTRTAARQIYVYAHAHAIGQAPEGGLERAERAFANLERHAFIDGDSPGFARAIRLDSGTVVDPVRDLYDHACVMIALAWLIRATGKDFYRTALLRLIAAMDKTFKAPGGGFAEDNLGTVPRRQNPHMHYFEACMALWECGCGPQYAARAGEIFGLFKSRLHSETTRLLYEYFSPLWETGEAYGSSRVEPGHMAEWVWLISNYDRLAGTENRDLGLSLLGKALETGNGKSSPFLLDEVDNAGMKYKDSLRLWPQVELLKAYLAASEYNSAYTAEAHRLAAAISDLYLKDGANGFWRDCFDSAGNFIASSIPGSSLYHLWTAAVEIERVLLKDRN